jgi:hypothetical protein
MDLKSEDYSIQYDEATQTITCQGALRLAELGEYAPLSQLLNSVLEQKPAQLTLDLRRLKFLNSSGFNILSKFVLKVRQEGTIRMIIQATKSIPWHEKSLKNLQRLMPSLQLEFD